MTDSSPRVLRKSWQRILYEKQPYKDNHVDKEQFLSGLNLSVNQGSTDPAYHRSVYHSASVVAQQFSVVAAYLTVYRYISMSSTPVLLNLAMLDTGLLVCGWLVDTLFNDDKGSLGQSIHTTLLFVGCLRIIAPVLKNLTHSFSGDTIEALAIAFAALHLVSHDYAFINNEVRSYSGTLSLNAAMFTAIILASRLEDIDLVVLFILLAIICFSWFPAAARIVKKRSVQLHIAFLCCQWCFTSTLIYFLDTTLFAMYQLGTFLLVLVGPYCYIKMQTYKRSLSGPWDIAELE